MMMKSSVLDHIQFVLHQFTESTVREQTCRQTRRANTNCIVIGLKQQWVDPIIYRTRCERANHYTTATFTLIAVLHLTVIIDTEINALSRRYIILGIELFIFYRHPSITISSIISIDSGCNVRTYACNLALYMKLIVMLACFSNHCRVIVKHINMFGH